MCLPPQESLFFYLSEGRIIPAGILPSRIDKKIIRLVASTELPHATLMEAISG
jgi:hypothetical protein